MFSVIAVICTILEVPDSVINNLNTVLVILKIVHLINRLINR